MVRRGGAGAQNRSAEIDKRLVHYRLVPDCNFEAVRPRFLEAPVERGGWKPGVRLPNTRYRQKKGLMANHDFTER